LDFGAEVQPVGRLAIHERKKIYFEYNRAFIRDGVEILAFYLPLKSGVVSFDYVLFEGLPGVFNNSLPDG
jgi:serine/threonine-protein kinase HipA